VGLACAITVATARLAFIGVTLFGIFEQIIGAT
jgi:hypothetical protein